MSGFERCVICSVICSASIDDDCYHAVYQRDFLGITVAVVGAITVVLSANPSDTQLDPDALLHAISQRVFVVYSVVYIVAAVILSGLSESDIGRKYVFVDVGLCAIFGV